MTTGAVQTCYTLKEFADMAGMSKPAMARLLMTGKVEFTWVGKRRLVLLAEVQQKMPMLWESMVTRASLAQAVEE